MRKSFDGLHAIIQSEFQRDVRLGDLFLFLNRRRDRLKLMYWDRDGLAIWMKRLERGTFQRPLPSPGADARRNGRDRSDAVALGDRTDERETPAAIRARPSVARRWSNESLLKNAPGSLPTKNNFQKSGELLRITLWRILRISLS